MKNIEDINKAAIQKITANKKITDFSPGDTIKVGVKIVEGKRERIQYFEGVCIAKKSRDLNSSFTVRKVSFGEGVERTFPLYGTLIESINVPYKGKVLSTPSPNEIFLTVKDEFKSLLFLQYRHLQNTESYLFYLL